MSLEKEKGKPKDHYRIVTRPSSDTPVDSAVRTMDEINPEQAKRWDPAAIQQHLQLITKAEGVPNLLCQLFIRNRDQDLYTLLVQIRDFQDRKVPPEYQQSAIFPRIYQAITTLLVSGILDVCIDIAFADRWYDPIYDDVERSLEVSYPLSHPSPLVEM